MRRAFRGRGEPQGAEDSRLRLAPGAVQQRDRALPAERDVVSESPLRLNRRVTDSRAGPR